MKRHEVHECAIYSNYTCLYINTELCVVAPLLHNVHRTPDVVAHYSGETLCDLWAPPSGDSWVLQNKLKGWRINASTIMQILNLPSRRLHHSCRKGFHNISQFGFNCQFLYFSWSPGPRVVQTTCTEGSGQVKSKEGTTIKHKTLEK